MNWLTAPNIRRSRPGKLGQTPGGELAINALTRCINPASKYDVCPDYISDWPDPRAYIDCETYCTVGIVMLAMNLSKVGPGDCRIGRRLMHGASGTENEMEIRRATPDDAVALARVHIDSWRSAYRGLVPDSHLDRLDYEQRAQRFHESLAQNAEESYVAEQDGELLGFLTLGGCRDADVDQETTGEIWGIYLAPRHWRKGVGTLLCRYGEGILKARGYRSATLWVFAGNDHARRFYEAMGFKADGASKTLNPGAPLEALRYRKQLGDAEPGNAADCGGLLAQSCGRPASLL